MGDIVERLRHEVQAATKLVLEHQSKNCHLHAEIERLRVRNSKLHDALTTVLNDLHHAGIKIADDVLAQAEEALGDE